MKELQLKVKEFVDARDWETPGHMKDFLLNICEECGEAWHIVKWIEAEKEAELIEKHRAEFLDFVGDQLYLIMRIANIAGVDAKEALEATLKEYEERFPVKEMKGKHANLFAGGIDHKYN